MHSGHLDGLVCFRVETINRCAISDGLDDIDRLLGFAISDDDVEERRGGQLQADERRWAVSAGSHCALWPAGLARRRGRGLAGRRRSVELEQRGEHGGRRGSPWA